MSDELVKCEISWVCMHRGVGCVSTYIGIPSRQPIFPRNRYAGRIRAKSVAPNLWHHLTVFLIKQHIFKIEDMKYDPQSALELSKSALNAGERVSISPGSVETTSEDPMEL